MKILVLGYSGSGKSTLARNLASRLQSPLLHLDTIQFKENWQERNIKEGRLIIQRFLKNNSCWVIDGDYSKFYLSRRIELADQIVILKLNRFQCLCRVIKRYLIYAHKTRPDIARGCLEKLDIPFIKWVLWQGRGNNKRILYRSIRAYYPHKTIILKSQKQIDAFLKGWV